jgi:Fe-S cluster biogenesis protein NfuA
MTTRSDEEIVVSIKELLESHVKPAVAGHGGTINFVTYSQGTVLLELGGACSGCAGSTQTLKMGVENMLRHYVPEIEQVDSVDDPNSNVSPYYEEDPFFSMNEDLIDTRDISNGELNESNTKEV